MMKEFIKDYVQVMLESEDIIITPNTFQKIIDKIYNCDELWDTFDSFISEIIHEEVK